ncbi:MAG: hypothetical protein NDI94_03800 [Candidatus Woesearchaeota archaeon]|nr:hypothetical protein [Candidatus Woesearchaeota archaeon]
MSRINSRKGYFFIIDAIFAAIILSIGFMIISSGSKPRDETPLPVVADNLLDIISRTKISDLCNQCVCTQAKLQETCALTKNYEQTILDHMTELYVLNRQDKARELFISFLPLIRQDLYGVELRINNVQIYSDTGQEKTNALISRKKISFGYIETPATGAVTYFGPYLIEVNLWEK